MMKNALFNFGVGSLLALTLALGGCGKQAAPVPTLEAKPSPRPSATPEQALFDGNDLNTDKLRDKANKAADSIGKYLDTQDPKLRSKFQKLSNKITDQLGKEKGHWREKLEAKQRDLEPQIAKLREQLSHGGDTAKDKLREQLSELEKQSGSTDEKLAKLKTIGADAWKQFKAQLKADQAKDKSSPAEGATLTPAPEG